MFSGNDPTKWQRQLSTYSRVNLGQVYEGITLKLKAAGNNVEKLFYVTPQTNVEQIRMHIEGSQGLSVNDSQELVVATELGDVKFSAPIAFQEIDGKRVDVEVVYSIKEDNVYGFTVASYDNSHQLVIDPVLSSTIIGGSDNDDISAIVLDANKNVYIAGTTSSPNMPNNNLLNPGYNSGYVAKLTPNLDSIVYFTYMGGSRWNGAGGVDIDNEGNAYITGGTFSSDFPATFKNIKNSCQEVGDGFLVKVDSTGNFLYSTCFGGNGAEGGNDIIVVEKNIVYISGATSSDNFPVIDGGYDNSYSGNGDGYVIKLNIATDSITYGTYLGGSGKDCLMSGSCAMARDKDKDGFIYITGDTTSSEEDFPIEKPLCIGDSSCSTYNGAIYHGGGGAIWDGGWGGDIFVTKLKSDLSEIVYSTYLGGSGYEESYGITVDSASNVYVVGSTDSKDFPLKGTLKPAGDELSNSDTKNVRNDDAFLAKLSFKSNQLTLDFSTLLGGSKGDGASVVISEDGEDIYMAGRTYSNDLFDGFFNEENQPLGSNAFSNTFKGSEGKYDGFLAKLKWNKNTEKLRMEFGAYLGGSDKDAIGGIVLDDQGHLYLTGFTRSSNFPKNHQLGTRGKSDGFIIKATPTIACIPPPDDMVAWYPFDETSGNVAHDIIGENDGTVNDGAEHIIGKIGHGLDINYWNSSVNIPNKDELNIRSGNDFSTDFWFKWNRNTGIILDKSFDDYYDSTDGYEIFIISPTCMVLDQVCPRYVEVAIDGNILNTGSCGLPNSPYSHTPWNWISQFWESEWIHLALTIDNESSKSTVALYLNGEECNSKEYMSEMDTATILNLKVGVQTLTKPAPANGLPRFRVDELKFFNQTLSPTDVRSIYETGRNNISYCKVDFQGDTDNDGVLTSEENLAPNSGDGNGDGILDSQQNNVTSLPNAENGNYLTLQVEPANCELANVEVKTETLLTIDPYYDYPYGLIEFEAQCENAEVTVFYHGATKISGEYRKYGPEIPGSNTSKWYGLRNDADFSNNVESITANIGNQSVPAITFDLANNKRGDDTDANDGKIVDIGGFAGPPAVIYYSASGKVLDTQSNAIAGVTIKIGDKTAITDATGYWEITGLPEGDNHIVTASKPGYTFLDQDFAVGNDENSTVVIIPISNLKMKVTASSRTVRQDDNLTYTITVINGGEEPATGIVLTDELPEGTSLVSFTATNGGECNADTLTCSLPDLTTGNSAKVELVIHNSQANNLVNTATVTSNEYPTDVVKTWTRVIPHLSVSISDTPDPIAMAAGERILHYTITAELSPNAPTAATGIELISTLPKGVEIQAINSDAAVCEINNPQTVTCQLQDLSVTNPEDISSVNVALDVKLNDAGLLVLTNETKVAANEYPAHTYRERTQVFVPPEYKVKLAFVIDVTGSMSPEMNGVKRAILDVIKELKGQSTFPLSALVVFRDDVSVKAVTSDGTILTNAVERLKASQGGTCPEASAEALNKAIDHIEDGGSILFVTDASPYEDADIDALIERLLSHNIRVNVLMTGDCTNPDSWNKLPSAE